MHQQLMELLNNAYSPYSNVKVAAILVTKDGRGFKGVNVENASNGATICAERSAIMNAISNGQKGSNFKEIHLISSMDFHLYPCGLCRQVMTEFFADDLKIYVWNKEGKYEVTNIKELVPHKVERGFY